MTSLANILILALLAVPLALRGSQTAPYPQHDSTMKKAISYIACSPESGNIAIRKDLTGKRFGKLTVIGFAGLTAQSRFSCWECRCDCGKITVAIGSAITRGNTSSCGCLLLEVNRSNHTKHGCSRNGQRSAEYKIWCGIKARCETQSATGYKNYGGSGIKMCDRWVNSFEDFLSDMGERPSLNHSVDRIDYHGDYSPENCRWATRMEQARNCSRNRWLMSKEGIVMIVTDWMKMPGYKNGHKIKSLLLSGELVEVGKPTPLTHHGV